MLMYYASMLLFMFEYEFITKCASSQMSTSVNTQYKMHWDNRTPKPRKALTDDVHVQKAIRYFFKVKNTLKNENIDNN